MSFHTEESGVGRLGIFLNSCPGWLGDCPPFRSLTNVTNAPRPLSLPCSLEWFSAVENLALNSFGFSDRYAIVLGGYGFSVFFVCMVV